MSTAINTYLFACTLVLAAFYVEPVISQETTTDAATTTAATVRAATIPAATIPAAAATSNTATTNTNTTTTQNGAPFLQCGVVTVVAGVITTFFINSYR